MDPMREQIARMHAQNNGMATAGGGFNPYAAGDKRYGLAGSPAATSGPVSAAGQQGYAQRDREQEARKAAVLQRMQAAQNGNYMDPAVLRGRQI